MLNTSLKFIYELFNKIIELPSLQDLGATVNFKRFKIFPGKTFVKYSILLVKMEYKFLYYPEFL